MVKENKSPYLININGRVIDVQNARYSYRGHEHKLSYRTGKLLLVLIERLGQNLSRDDLLTTVWEGAVTTDHSLSKAISELRQAFGDKNKTAIVTVPRIGYRINPNCIQFGELPKSMRLRKFGWVTIIIIVSLILIMLVSPFLAQSLSQKESSTSLEELVQVTSSIGKEQGPSISPDGVEVVYVKNNENVFQLLINLIGSPESRVLVETNSRILPITRWSYDGKKIAYVQAELNNPLFSIWVVHRDGTQNRKVVETNIATSVEWLPDGEKLIYSHMDPESSVIKFNTIDVKRLTAASLQYPGDHTSRDVSPRLSGSGRYLAFRRGIGESSRLVIADLELQKLIFPASLNGWSEYDWIGTTDRLLVSHIVNDERRLWAIQPTGEKQRIIEEGTVTEISTARHSNTVVFTKKKHNLEIGLYQRPIELGAQVWHEIKDTTNNYAPALNPVNSQMAFISERTGYPAIWLYDIDRKRIAEQISFGREENPKLLTWSEDGVRLAYVSYIQKEFFVGIKDIVGNDLIELALDGISEVHSVSISDESVYLAADDEKGGSYLYEVNSGSKVMKRLYEVQASKIQYSSEFGGVLFQALGAKGVQLLALDTKDITMFFPIMGYLNRKAWSKFKNQLFLLAPISNGQNEDYFRYQNGLVVVAHNASIYDSKGYPLGPNVTLSSLSVNDDHVAVVQKRNDESDIWFATVRF